MRFYWIRDRVRQGQFIVYWRNGDSNRADYFSKHHPATHHKKFKMHMYKNQILKMKIIISASKIVTPNKKDLVRVC